MTDPDLYDSFYGGPIFGERYREELRPSSLTRMVQPRRTLSTIDPVVHHKSSRNHSGLLLSSDHSRYAPEPHHSLSHSHYRPLQKTLSNTRGRETIFSPPPLPSSTYTNRLSDRNFTITSHTSGTEHRLRDAPHTGTHVEHPVFYSRKDDLTWNRLHHRSVEREDTNRHRHSHNKPLKNRSTVIETKRYDDALGLANARQQSTEEEDSVKNYRTVLYVVPSSPKSQSPAYWGSPRAELTPTARSSPSPAKLHLQNFTYTDSVKSVLKQHSREELVRSENNESSTDDASSSEQSLAHEPPKSTIIFQGPGRYLETKPYCKTIPSPQLMEVRRQPNGLQAATQIQETPALPQHNPLRLIQNDFNRVVVDIKPRHLHEADKQQHVSQWIQVGTLGDTVQSKLDVTEFINDDNDLLNPTDVEDGIDGVDGSAEINTAGPHDKRALVNKSFNDYTIDSVSSPISQNSDWFQRSSRPKWGELSGIPEERSISETVHTDSIESNGVVNKKTKADKVSVASEADNVSGTARTGTIKSNVPIKIYQPSTNVTTEVVSRPTNNEKTGVMYSKMRENSESSLPRTLTQTTLGSSHTNSECAKPPMPIHSHNDLGHEREERISQLIKPKPEVAPKPNPQQKLLAMAERRPLTPTLAELQQAKTHIFNPNRDRLSQLENLPRTTNNTPIPSVIHSEVNGEKSLTAEVITDTPTPRVRNLAAYFTSIINRNKNVYESNTFPRMRWQNPPKSNSLDERGMPSSSSPFFQHETPEERERRLRAVEALRHRTLPVNNIDYSSVGSLKTIKALYDSTQDDYYPYVRPSSAPRPRPKCMITNITRSTTTLADDLNK